MRDSDTCQGKTAQQEDLDSMAMLVMLLSIFMLIGLAVWGVWP